MKRTGVVSSFVSIISASFVVVPFSISVEDSGLQERSGR